MDDTLHKYGGGSPQMAALYRKMAAADSFNLVKVTAILEKYGWLSADRVGVDQNSALFMVIQHSNLKTQEKYLPVMRKAVEQGNAQARELALLEDRVAIGEGRKQVYGSQLSWNQQTNVMYVLPMEDPDSVDQRRAKMGLQPMADYLKEGFNLTWDLEAYKKDMSNHPLKPGMH